MRGEAQVTMIDRDSAGKLLKVLREDSVIRAEIVCLALENALERGLRGENLPENAEPLDPESQLIDKLERFFGIVIQVAPLPPVAYTAKEVSMLARYSEGDKLNDAAEATSSPDTEDMVGFYSSIAHDYAEIAEAAERGDIKDALWLFGKLDTADRENFGWGHDTWDEARWSATLDEARGI